MPVTLLSAASDACVKKAGAHVVIVGGYSYLGRLSYRHLGRALTSLIEDWALLRNNRIVVGPLNCSWPGISPDPGQQGSNPHSGESASWITPLLCTHGTNSLKITYL